MSHTTNTIVISDGITSFTIGQSGATGTDVNLGGTTQLAYFDDILGGAGADTVRVGCFDGDIDAGAGAGPDTVLVDCLLADGVSIDGGTDGDIDALHVTGSFDWQFVFTGDNSGTVANNGYTGTLTNIDTIQLFWDNG